MNSLPSRLKACPENHGRHQWIMHAANVFVNAGWKDDDAEMEIVRLLTREAQPTEVSDAFRKARCCGAERRPIAEPTRHLGSNKKPTVKFDPQKLERIAKRLPAVNENWLSERSPTRIDRCSPEAFLQAISGNGENILIFSTFRSQGQHLWYNRGSCLVPNELTRFTTGCSDGVWYLSNPCDGQWRCLDRLKSPYNPSGRTRRAEENITAFRYAVLESDDAQPQHWLSTLAQMPLPIVSIVTSGGRSLHSLVRVNAQSKSEWDDIVRGKLRHHLTLLGADDGALTAVRLTRLPFCMRYRSGGDTFYEAPRQQKLIYLNPRADGTPIVDLL